MKDETGNSPDLIFYIDGASRGNPGMAAAGVFATDSEGNRVCAIGRYLGLKTNNEAEYWALLLALREAKRRRLKSIRIYTDSELISRQMQGLYRVKHPRLKPLHRKASDVLKSFVSFEIESIPRDRNGEADRLANEAIDRRLARK